LPRLELGLFGFVLLLDLRFWAKNGEIGFVLRKRGVRRPDWVARPVESPWHRRDSRPLGPAPPAGLMICYL